MSSLALPPTSLHLHCSRRSPLDPSPLHSSRLLPSRGSTRFLLVHLALFFALLPQSFCISPASHEWKSRSNPYLASRIPPPLGLLSSCASHAQPPLAWSPPLFATACFSRGLLMSVGSRCGAILSGLLGRGLAKSGGSSVGVTGGLTGRSVPVAGGGGQLQRHRLQVGNTIMVATNSAKAERSRIKDALRVLERRMAMAAKSDDTQEGLVVFDEMKAAGLPITKNAWNMMLKLCQSGGLNQRAFEVFEEMRAVGIQATESTYSQMVRTCAGSGDIEQAAQMVRECVAKGIVVRLRTFQPIIGHFLAQGDLRRAFEWWDEMLQVVSLSSLLPSCPASRTHPLEPKSIGIIVVTLMFCSHQFSLLRPHGADFLFGSDLFWSRRWTRTSSHP